MPGDVIGGIELKQGDILLERAELGLTHSFIVIGQKLGNFKNILSLSSSKARTVHAAIYVGEGRVSQSSGEGLTTDPLNGNHKWKVYRYNANAELAAAAADVAQNMVIRSQNDAGFGKYKTLGNRSAVASAFKPGRKAALSANDVSSYLDNLYSGDQSVRNKTRRFFCSNFTVLCYSLASEWFGNNPHYAMDLDFERTSPSEMARYFESKEGKNKGWTRVGEIKG